MKKLLIYLFLYLPLSTLAQDKGIQFVEGLSWDQIKQKAKDENKYIFVDCYTTWCAPCKAMEKYVYTNDTVGNYMKDKFISVKAQMDTSNKDNHDIQAWYSDANYLMTQFNVAAYPTFLFFTPDGKLIHRAIGYLNPQEFISAGADAIDSKKQYYKLISDYQNGKRDTAVMKKLALSSKYFGNDSLAKEIAADYIKLLPEKQLLSKAIIMFVRDVAGNRSLAKALANKLISTLSNKELFIKANVLFIRQFTENSSDKGFDVFYRHTKTVNKILGEEGYSQRHVEYVIAREIIDPVLFPPGGVNKRPLEPNWDSLFSAIKLKYGAIYASRTVANGKIRWYTWKKNWNEVTKNTVLYVSKYGAGLQAYFLNNYAWTVFEHSSKTSELNAAISWMERAVNMDLKWPIPMDTYANLLYKVGKTEEAIKWEEKALKLVIKEKDEERMILYKETIEKMKTGKPTY